MTYEVHCNSEWYMFKYPYNKKCTFNTSKTDDYKRACKKYTLGNSRWDLTIDLPPELDVGSFPTLGPKVNHHFR